MAIRFDNSADRIYRTANTLPNSNWTVTFWLYPVSLASGFSTVMWAGPNNDTYSNMLWVGIDGTSWATDTAAAYNTGGTVAINTWYHVALRRSSGALTVWVNGSQISAVANTVGTLNTALWEFGGWGPSGFDSFNGRIAHIKRWHTALSQAEIAAEMAYQEPVTSGAVAWWLTPSGATRHQDSGPSGWHFTTAGTLTDEAGPGIPLNDGGGVEEISAAHLASTATLYGATLVPGEVAIDAALIPGSSTLHGATLDTEATISADHIESAASLHGASLDPGEATISAAHIGSTATLYGAALATEGTIAAAHLDSGAVLYGAAIATTPVGQYTVTFTASDNVSTGADALAYEIRTATGGGGTLLASGTATSGVEETTATLFDTTLEEGENTRYLYVTDEADNTLEEPFIVNASLSGEQTITAAHLGSTVTLFGAGFIYDQTLDAAHLASTAELYGGTLAPSQQISAAHIPSAAELYGAALEPGAASIEGALLASQAALYGAELVAGGVTLAAAHLASEAALYGVTLTAGEATLLAAHLASTAETYGATLTFDQIIEAAFIESGAVLYPATLKVPVPGRLRLKDRTTRYRLEDQTAGYRLDDQTARYRLEDRTAAYRLRDRTTHYRLRRKE